MNNISLIDLNNRLKMLKSYGISKLKKLICENASISLESLRLVLNGKVQNDKAIAATIAVIEYYEQKRATDIRTQADIIKERFVLEMEPKLMEKANALTPEEINMNNFLLTKPKGFLSLEAFKKQYQQYLLEQLNGQEKTKSVPFPDFIVNDF